MGARSYDPSSRAFTTRDTVMSLSSVGRLIRTAYGSGDPVNHFEPDGHFGRPRAMRLPSPLPS
jgi:RHS repeat-associated protein